MNYEVLFANEFQREVKQLIKKYRAIKKDLLNLVDILENDAFAGINLGSNIYKIRVKNSDTGGKSGGYRVIYYTHLSNDRVYLLSIYSKTKKENINIKELQPIIDKINK